MLAGDRVTILSTRKRWELAEALRGAAEDAFNACPWWRPGLRERLRDERTTARLRADDALWAHIDTLSLDERRAFLAEWRSAMAAKRAERRAA